MAFPLDGLQRMTAVLLLSRQGYFVMQTDGYMQSLNGVLTAPQLADAAPLMNGTRSLSNYPAIAVTKYEQGPEGPCKHSSKVEMPC
jgi:hypothetical protein